MNRFTVTYRLLQLVKDYVEATEEGFGKEYWDGLKTTEDLAMDFAYALSYASSDVDEKFGNEPIEDYRQWQDCIDEPHGDLLNLIHKGEEQQ